jgi:hypothetical protein
MKNVHAEIWPKPFSKGNHFKIKDGMVVSAK